MSKSYINGLAFDDKIADSILLLQKNSHLYARNLKEQLCYCALDFAEETQKYTNSPSQYQSIYKLAGKTEVVVGAEKFQIVEQLFKMSEVKGNLVSRVKESQNFRLNSHHAVPSVQEIIQKSIRACDPTIQAEMLSNIVLSGGTTMLPGFAERLSKELKQLFPKDKVNVIALPNRQQLEWNGSCILSSQLKPEEWMLKAEYDEIGPNLVHRKCFM